jgi:hypothetical protein
MVMIIIIIAEIVRGAAGHGGDAGADEPGGADLETLRERGMYGS